MIALGDGARARVWDTVRNPHLARGRAMIAAHPDLRELVGPDPATAVWIALLWAIQMGLAAVAAMLPWWAGVMLAYLVGAIAALGLWTLLHECSHNLAARRSSHNRILGLVAASPLLLPVAAPFTKYHLLHHSHQGDPVRDGDIASAWERRWVGDSPVRKALWLAAGALMQALRPIRMFEPLFDRAMVVNVAVQALFVPSVGLLLGTGALLYLFAANIFALGLHPLGARWIQEHFILAEEQETASYYGPLNRWVFNAGYHVEHHDLPGVAWSRLPQLSQRAPEFYRELMAHTSWTRLLVRFLFDRSLTLGSRGLRVRGDQRPR